MSKRPLDELQAWFQEAIMQPAHAPPDLQPTGPAELLSATSRQSSGERLAVYQRAYTARLLDVLRQEFPVLVHVLGPNAFSALAAAYLAEHPSRSYTLTDLGAEFPGFLAKAQRGSDDSATFPEDWATLLADIALWERTTCEIYSGPGLETESPFDPERLAALPLDEWLTMRLRPAPCLRLLKFRHAAPEFCLSVRRGVSPPRPASGVTLAAASRSAYRVRWRTLAPAEFELLQALTSGATVGEALAVHCERGVGAAGVDAAVELRGWFHAWAREAYFCAAT